MHYVIPDGVLDGDEKDGSENHLQHGHDFRQVFELTAIELSCFDYAGNLDCVIGV